MVEVVWWWFGCGVDVCVTVRTLSLLVSSVSVILSVARAVIHDMLHLMVHQGCDPF